MMLQRRLAPVYCANITATDFGLKGLPRSLRWPCSASDAEIARKLSFPPFGLLRGLRSSWKLWPGRAGGAVRGRDRPARCSHAGGRERRKDFTQPCGVRLAVREAWT
jgi:hypothetical protein